MKQIGSRFWATADKDSLDLTDYWKHKWFLQGAGHNLHTFSKLSLTQGRSLGMVKVEHCGVGYSSCISTDWKLPKLLTQLSSCALHTSAWRGCQSAPALTAWLHIKSRFDNLSDVYGMYQILLACSNLSRNCTSPLFFNIWGWGGNVIFSVFIRY